jgi:uncharacterized protein (DUF983 family)
MAVPRKRHLLRGIRGCCPRCGVKDVFKSRYRLHEQCPACGLPLEQEDGWGLGAIPLNYAITCVLWVLPVGLIFLFGWISLKVALVLAGLGALILPFLTYRFSKLLWIGIYYAVLPHEAEPDKAD